MDKSVVVRLAAMLLVTSSGPTVARGQALAREQVPEQALASERQN